MRSSSALPLLTAFLLFLSLGCSTQWTEVIRYGDIEYQTSSQAQLAVEPERGLMFLPVTIAGKEYRFLFDSGAPFSISQELQDTHAFSIVSKGRIVDSDHNRKKVLWAQVDMIDIAGVQFKDLAAFVGDFDASPMLSCLEIDGIIGSNLMRHCNWSIDPAHETLSLFENMDSQAHSESLSIPFETDHQYNIFIDLAFGKNTVKHLLVDYGSNGSISLNKAIYSTLEDESMLGDPFIETGTKQSGIVGEAVSLSRKLSLTDSLRIDTVNLEDVLIRTGKTTSVGNDFLSRFRVTIDWEDHRLYLEEIEQAHEPILSAGFRLGYTPTQGLHVQSVLENSIAFEQGVRPEMKVSKVDSLDFEKGDAFCDYVGHSFGAEIYLQVIDSRGERVDLYFEKTRLN